jgi:hypothetical protein
MLRGCVMTSEIVAATESALQGDHIGRHERTDNGALIKPLGATHEDMGGGLTRSPNWLSMLDHNAAKRRNLKARRAACHAHTSSP